jgi:hypothetical protein
MKKRSMLAIASLATGFVVAAVTPSHAVGGDTALGALNMEDALNTVNNTVSNDVKTTEQIAPAQHHR